MIDLARMSDPAAALAGVEATKAHIRSSRVAPGFSEILLPGEPERRSAARAAGRRDSGGRSELGADPRGGGNARDHRSGIGTRERLICRAVRAEAMRRSI